MDRERLNRRHFLPLLKRAGLSRIRFHDLRHTAATLMIQRGVHIRVVADILGHSDPAITMRVYGHVVPAMHQAAVAAMEGLLLQQPLQQRRGGRGCRLAETDG
jgi:integrase